MGCYAAHNLTVLSSRLVYYLPEVLKIEVCHFERKKKKCHQHYLGSKAHLASSYVLPPSSAAALRDAVKFRVIPELQQLERMINKGGENCSVVSCHTGLFLQTSATLH